MVEINNQRKGVPRYAGVVGGNWITTSENQKSWLWRHCRRRAIYWLLRSPRKLVTLNPKLKINRRRTLPASFPVGGMPTASSLAWKTFRKVRTLWHCSRLRSVALTHDWSWWYPSGNRPLQQYLGFVVVLVMVSSSIRLTAWLQNSKKRAERSERLMYEQSHRDYSALVICIIVCLSWAVNQLPW